jgi:DNA repair protein RecN (Recombination protein N)
VFKELHIENFAIIDDLHLTLEPGFNILTGETGAGKSILIDAVTLILGSRADTTVLRQGANQARVEGMFVLSPSLQATLANLLSREGLEGDSSEILWLSREVRDNGRSVARVNGRVVSLSIMRDIGERLIDIHGQSEHLSLLRTPEHLRLLDRYAGLEGVREKVGELVREITLVRRELKRLLQDERDRMQRIDLLRFQVNEIRSAQLKEDEKDLLEAELVRLNNAEQLSSLASATVSLIEDGTREIPAVLDLLGQGQRNLSSLARIDATREAQVNTLSSIVYNLEDLAGTLRDYRETIEFRPKRLAWVEDRLVLLRQLERKYGRNLAEVIRYAESAEIELQMLENSDERSAELREQEEALVKDCMVLCQELSEARQKAARSLIGGMEKELDDLRMEGARLGILFTWKSAEDGLPLAKPLPSSVTITKQGSHALNESSVERIAFDVTGMDTIEFLVAPNVGEGLKPMARIASGGETARLMLALKTVLSRADRTPTLIFDEIDQGIGGRIGAVVGHKLWRLTSDCDEGMTNCHQVLCITHLPQLASFGDVHFKVAKDVIGDRTVTHVVNLRKPTRVEELAQMLGTQGTSAKQGAIELLEQAQVLKQLKTVPEL